MINHLRCRSVLRNNSRAGVPSLPTTHRSADVVPELLAEVELSLMSNNLTDLRRGLLNKERETVESYSRESAGYALEYWTMQVQNVLTNGSQCSCRAAAVEVRAE